MDAAQFAAYQLQVTADMQALHAQVQALTLQAAAAPHPGAAAHAAGAPPAPRAAEPRIPAPAQYDGKAAALDDWLSELGQQFAWYGASTGTDALRLRFATAYLRGAARDWWTHHPSPPVTWAAFSDALRARFQPVTAAHAARAKLLSLAQGKAPVNDYIAAFRRLLVSVPDMGEADKLFQFLRGLRPPIAAHLRIQNVTTLDAAVQMAARIGSVGEMAAAAQEHAGAASSSAAHAPMELDALLNIEGLEQETSGCVPQTAPGNAPATQAQLAELLNALRGQLKGSAGSGNNAGTRSGKPRRFGGPPRIPHLTPAQVHEYMAAGKCFGCGSKEHTSRGCPRRKIGEDGRVCWPQGN